MKLRTIAITSSIILRIIATFHHCLIILISGMCLVGCVVDSRPWPAWGLWPIVFSAIHLLAIWIPVQLTGMALKIILGIIVMIVDCALILFALFLFVVANFVALDIAEFSLGQLVLTFFLVLLPVGFAVINILAIWIPVLASLSTTPVEQNESKPAS